MAHDKGKKLKWSIRKVNCIEGHTTFAKKYPIKESELLLLMRRDVVPIPMYQNWYLYPYPSTHCGTRTRVSTWLNWYPYSYPYPYLYRGRLPVPVPLPIFQPSLVPVPGYLFWYPYPYLVPVDKFNISLAPRERDFILTNKQQKCAIAMLCKAMSLF